MRSCHSASLSAVLRLCAFAAISKRIRAICLLFTVRLGPGNQVLGGEFLSEERSDTGMGKQISMVEKVEKPMDAPKTEKQVGYEEEEQTQPNAVDEVRMRGLPYLSWLVSLLPYLSYLYQFR